MIKIELYNQETKKKETYTQTRVPARYLRKILQFISKTESTELNELEQLDELIALVSDFFDTEKVNFDSILDGVEANKLYDVLMGIVEKIMGEEDEKKQQAENLVKVTK